MIFCYYLNNVRSRKKENSFTYNNTNPNLMNNQNDDIRIINDIIDKNMDTFLKSIKFAQKFYSDVFQSYHNYIITKNKSVR